MKGINKKLVLDYLKRNRLMALGTVSRGRPWGATVFFAYDNNLNIFFYSRPDTKHSQHIRKNALVAIAINQDHGSGGFVKGMQIIGRARAVLERDFKKHYAIYRKRFPWADKFKSDHKLYLVKPLEIHYIDQKRFGHFFRVKMK